jgi:integrase
LGLEKYINELNLFKIQNLFALPHPTNVFTRYKQLIDFPAEQERRKVFHSFRHTFVSQLQLAHVPLEVRQNLVGHTSGNITVDIYGTDSSLKDKFEGIKKLAFENLKILPYTPTTQFRAKRRARMARAKKK